MATPPDYAELHCISNFTFLRGASHPEELVEQAATLGYRALALTDECSLAGTVRAHEAAQRARLHLLVGAEFRLDDGLRFALIASDRTAYGDLAQLITRGRRNAPKGEYRLTRADLAHGLDGCLALWLPGRDSEGEHAQWLAQRFPNRTWIAVELLLRGDDRARLAALQCLGKKLGLGLVAAGDVHMHTHTRRPLQDTLTAIRLGTPLTAAGLALAPNGERYLHSRESLGRLYPRELLAETVAIAERCTFSLDELRYDYPDEWLPPGITTTQYLRQLTEEGLRRRWPDGTPEKVRAQVEHELALIAELHYEAYFLTVHDLVQFARSRNILCQGRGSAANSAVCYCLGITEVDPARMETLFERFISKERNEPPDIDVDFEHERREEVIQYIYTKYGRERAGMTANVITYRPRSAVRDVGKALGLDLEQVDRLAKALAWWDKMEALPARVRAAGFDPAHPTLRRLMALANTLIGFPRHLSQHVGGMVISRTPLSRLVPIENAAMEGRTVIQWDKNDLDTLGLLKIDCLALGMLTAVHRAFDLIAANGGPHWTMATIPPEDARVYAMIQHADTIGVFQIESRAQMAMLPRLKPKTFYDLVIEIAIVRPGPIQGDMVHPYLRRREGNEPIAYPNDEVRAVLARTLGVPIFQEQVIKLAMVAAGFSPGEADQLRRSMASWSRHGTFAPFEQRLLDGMRARGYSEEFARQIYQQIQGFGEYGFPESHSASFALIAYVSAWLKHHEPAAFTCALLNSQPMGFYAPSQLIQDAQRHGVVVRPVNARVSAWDCTLEDEGRALRLGLRIAKGLSRGAAERLCAARVHAPFASIEDLARRANLARRDLRCLAAANAFATFARNPRQAQWQIQGLETPTPLLASAPEGLPLLPAPTPAERVFSDYAATGLSLRGHPLALLRAQLNTLDVTPAARLRHLPNGTRVRLAGLVITRQRPGGSGVVFLTLEDETGTANVIVWPRLVERARAAVTQAELLGVNGELQRQGEVMHVIARGLEDLAQRRFRLFRDRKADSIVARRNFK